MNPNDNEPTLGAASSRNPGSSQPGAWERSVLERLVMDIVAERRRSRRWKVFFRLCLLALVVAGVAAAWRGGGGSATGTTAGPHVAVVDLQGEMSSTSNASADNIDASLRDAFASPQTRAVILRINSPGGSPVQASRINAEIWRLRALHKDIPVYAVCDEACASAAYYVAVAADRIYVNPASLVGSIGVLMNGFDFSGLMGKLGITRRLLTAGSNKGFMDPFSPMSPQQKQYALAMLEQIHQQFIAAVKKGRGARLKIDDQTFSGLVWTGEAALGQGLADGYGDTRSVARDVVHEPRLVDYTRHENVVDRLAQRFGAAIGMGAAREALPADWSLR
ncbi:S49 family peptidase [Thiomonas sp. FB-6]|uniref:S49 family peptidase n=1 Tax=Thiomonas sp. FB-6 TaxID=1158291 RepID=UPI0003685FE5|nr:S49 family peptidase [Thiomonas sp. FB-6]